MALLKGGTVVNGTITGTLIGNADTATAIKISAIAASTDLNTLTSSGTYSATATVAASCTNSPITNADFLLKVEKLSDSLSLQHIYGANDASQVYSRSVGSTVGSWYKLTGE